MKKELNKEQFSLGMAKLVRKYQITKAQVFELATKHPEILYFSEDGLYKVVMGIIKLALKLQEKSKESKTKLKAKKSCIKPKVKRVV